MQQDIWHFPRHELANQLVNSIRYNIIHSFTLFAPRRIGKTYFLNYDLKPALDLLEYKTIYFSFADQIGDYLEQFKRSLIHNVDYSLLSKLKIQEISFSWCKIIIDANTKFSDLSILELLSILAHNAQKNNSKIVLMLDEIQELINLENANGFIGELRTALDLNKNYIKVIFTGSSRHGLQKMFNDNKAPFFHFGTSLKMDVFDRDFTDFLALVYHNVTGRSLNQDQLFVIFQKLNFVTLSIREFLSFYAMYPALSLLEAYEKFEYEVFNKNDYASCWRGFSVSEKLLFLGLINNMQSFYSDDFYNFAKECYRVEITQGRIQHALNKLLRHGYIHQHENGEYEIEDLFMRHWLENKIRENEQLTLN